MTDEQHRKLDEFHGLKKCDNPECKRSVTKGTAYCCGSCGSASSQYEIHEQGLLAHSEGCNERHKRRSATKPTTTRVRGESSLTIFCASHKSATEGNGKVISANNLRRRYS